MTSVSSWSMVEFRAMGSPCRVVAPEHEHAHLGRELVLELERRWTRFDPASEISRANRCAGDVTILSAVTYELISLAQRARDATAGAFNPLMLDRLVALGYDRTWESLSDSLADFPEPVSAPSEVIDLFPEISAVRLPAGTRFDPGGIGKGMAGDMVASALLDAGAESVQIELGGDVRVAGTPWTGEEWRVDLDDTDHGVSNPASISLIDGGVATSSVMRRRWRCGGVEAHHLIDAGTGLPALTDLDSVTAVAPTLWWAEVIAKVAVIRGRRAARLLLQELGMAGVLVSNDANDRYEVITRMEVAA